MIDDRIPEVNWVYNGVFIRAKDGDTVVLDIDQGFYNSIRLTTRLYGLNTPEIHGVPKDSAEYKAGKAAESYVLNWMEEAKGKVIVKSYDSKAVKTEKYGRWLVVIYRSTDPVSLNDALLKASLAKHLTY